MEEEKTNYSFEHSFENRVELVCPKCGKHIISRDIEMYRRCPFCDVELDFNDELNEYTLKRDIDNWSSVRIKRYFMTGW